MIVYKKLRKKNCPAFIFDNMLNIKDIDLSAIGVNKTSNTLNQIHRILW